MSAAAEQKPHAPRDDRSNSSANADAMDVRGVNSAVVVIRNRNGRRNSSVHPSSSRRLRRPRASGREGVAAGAVAEVAAKNRIRRLRNNSSNRVRRANRGRRKPRVRMPRVRHRARKVTDQNGAAVFDAAEAVAAADRKALRRRRSHAETRGPGERLQTISAAPREPFPTLLRS